jgi:DNA repair protein RecO (recombination protein O)
MPSRERSFRLEAIVLRHNDWGEADRLLGLYSRERGKLRAIAKGVRKLRSRKAGHLEPFTRVSLLLAQARDMPIITQADTIEAFLPIKEDLTLLAYASYVIELLDQFTYEEGENQALYRLLADTLGRLAQGDPPQLVARYYDVRILDLLGFRPHLFHCATCEKEIQPVDQYFSAQQGGVLCPSCGSEMAGAQPISVTALKYLRHFQRSAYPAAARAIIAPAIYQEMERLLQHYLTYLLERGLKTPAFLRRIRRLEQTEPDIPLFDLQLDND